jgi:hypothetical protein
MSFRLFRGSDLAGGPTMLDDGTVKKYKQEIQARNPSKKPKKGWNVHEAHHLH